MEGEPVADSRMTARRAMDATGLGHWSGRTVLVTGFSGFIGSWLTTALSHLGARVYGFALDDAHTRTRSDLPVHHVSLGDIRDFEAVRRAMSAADFDAVFHLAAQPLVRVGLEDPRGTLETNIVGSVNLLEAARVCRPATVVHVTSDKCYRNKAWTWPYREVDELGGGCPYSVSKAAAELVFEGYVPFFASGEPAVRAASVRFGNVIGGDDNAPHRLVTDVMSALAAEEPVVLRRPEAVRPWQHVLDVVHGLLLLADALGEGSVATGAVLNFAPPGDGASARELAEALLRARSGTGQAGAAGIEERRADFAEEEILRLDGRMAATLLDWRHRFGLDEAAEAIADWHRQVRQGVPARTATHRQVRGFFDTASGRAPAGTALGGARL